MTTDVPLSTLIDTLSRIRATDSKNEKITIAAEYLRSIPIDIIEDSARLMIGQPIPIDLRSLGVQWSEISDIMMNLSQRNLFSEELTVRRVADAFREVARTVGPGARQKRSSIIRGLMIDASDEERRHLIGTITGDVRAGFSEGLMLDAIAAAAGISAKEATGVLGTLGDIGRTAAKLLGPNAEKDSAIAPMNPFRPMLAESQDSVRDAMSKISGRASVEYKLDGVRIQAHKKGPAVKIFTRQLKEVTSAFPEIRERLKTVECDSFITDGEVIAFKGKPLPFQEVMRRVTRERGIDEEAKDTPVKLQLFDILFLDGQPLMDRPYAERSKTLRGIFSRSIVVPRIITSDPDKADSFFKRSLKEGHEGVVVKALGGGYELGKRSGCWIKVKKHETIDAVIIAAEQGHGRRSRWFSNYHLGVRTPEGFAMVGKTFKGLTDAEFEMMTMRLSQILIEEQRGWITVRPEIVVEVEFNEIQKSPKYESAMALRFARISRIRDDKSPDEATTLDELRKLYERQFGGKARSLK